MSQKFFTLEPKEYTRDLNIVNAAERDIATYISKMTGKPISEVRAWVKDKMAGDDKFGLKNPRFRYVGKDQNGDRELRVTGLLEYIDDVVAKKSILAPTLTVYVSTKIKKSLLGSYIRHNMHLRKVDKKDMFDAEMTGDALRAAFKKIMQNTRKIKNNALSGAHGSPGTILYLKSGHPTLTSACRCATGYGNANNEKFLMGNRHYWHPTITMSNIVSIINNVDMGVLKQAMTKYNIHYPTAQDAMDCVLRSSKLYWGNKNDEARIFQLFERMLPIERAAFVYAGDMWHLAKHNEKLVRYFMSKMSTPVLDVGDTVVITDEEKAMVKKNPEALRVLACMLLEEKTRGYLFEKLHEENPIVYRMVAHTINHLVNSLGEFALMIKALWVTKVMPASIFSLPSIIRRCALVSDTDSTIFTNQWWTIWYKGKLDFTPESLRVAYTTTYLSSQTVIHQLAMMSGHYGVAEDQIHQLSMKNEYFFPVFVTTAMSKHYFALKTIQEGNVFKKAKDEIKGKNLRDSTLPPYIREGVKNFMLEIMNDYQANQKLDLDKVMMTVVNLERQIHENVLAAKFSDMSTTMIKEQASYSDPDSNPTIHYDMWMNVFAPKYGEIEQPPYRAVKFTTEMNSLNKIKKWLNSLSDKEFAARMLDWVTKNERTNLSTFYLPEMALQGRGVPEEVGCIVNVRKLIYGTLFPYYLVLESLGLYVVDPKYVKLAGDFYPPKNTLT